MRVFPVLTQYFEEETPIKDLEVDRRINTEMSVKQIRLEGMEWIQMAQSRVQQRDAVNTVYRRGLLIS
jgi:hypothetical protein